MGYQDRNFKICLSLFGCEELKLPNVHIVHWYDVGSVQAVRNRLLFHTFGELIACNHNAHFAKEENGKKKLVCAQGSESWLCAAQKTAATLLRAH